MSQWEELEITDLLVCTDSDKKGGKNRNLWIQPPPSHGLSQVLFWVKRFWLP